MKSLLILCFFVAAAVAITVPSQYTLTANVLLPYAGVNEKVDIAYDGVNNRMAVSFYNGQDGFIYRYDINTVYQLYTRVNKRLCVKKTASGSPSDLVHIIPDLTQYKHLGLVPFPDMLTNHYQNVVVNGSKTNVYDFYVAVNNSFTPYKFEMNPGYNIVWGSHFDQYVVSFTDFKPSVDAYVFDHLIAECQNAEESAVEPRGLSQLRYFFPDFHVSAARDVNEDFISTINNDEALSFTATHNKFSHMHEHEFRNMMLPKRGHSTPMKAKTFVAPEGIAIPDSWDWREHGAVTPVKDQGVCGSCWTFGTIGTIEGAYYLKTGRLERFSEQYIVDCIWTGDLAYTGNDPTNLGCDGGQQWLALEQIIHTRGVPLEREYPYSMQDGVCQSVAPKVVVTDYYNITFGSEEDLKKMIFLHGPVTISINVPTSMMFYADGVYNDPKCKNGIDDLEHAVLAVGYGSENGKDYWIVKNSWSTHWGDQGYIKMARNQNNLCGVASGASVARVDVI
eukprot:GCRY01000365.1.p1 GENE.GCRY01000365.1~~GCRY01000365.1.p1  ORF type:complete len:521 (+),score=130.25 GCRY01000365.1:46-1563(+)